TLRTAERDYNVFTNTQVTTTDEVRDVVVRPPAGEARAVRVRDVAEVVDGSQDQTELVRVNGRRGVYLRVLKQPGANTIAVADAGALPILVSAITTIVVFFPVLCLQGVARNLFVPLALTISFALMMSFFVSRTVTPLLCLYWLPGGKAKARIAIWIEQKLEG